MEKYFYFVFVMSFGAYIQCIEREITINIEPGKEDCFFQTVKTGETIDIEYQVVDGGHGDLDVTFHLVDPTGRILVADYKKSENNHRTDATMDGDYKFCFDNTFSTYNTKSVFFELIVEKDGDSDWNLDVGMDLQTENTDISVEDVNVIISAVRAHLSKARHLQDLIKSTEARDRNVAEENYFKVNTFSLVQIVIMICVGFIQVVMVRSLFDDQSKAHKIWKNFHR